MSDRRVLGVVLAIAFACRVAVWLAALPNPDRFLSPPDSAEYVRLNDRVKKNQVLCIIEAMKLMNEIEADIAGTVIGILVEDGAPVEYGQPLFKIAT